MPGRPALEHSETAAPSMDFRQDDWTPQLDIGPGLGFRV